MEGPAHVVALGQLAQRPAHVDVGVGGGDQVAREHDLLQLAGADARRPRRPTTDSQAAPLIAPSAKVTLRGAGGRRLRARGRAVAASSSWPMTVTQERPRGCRRRPRHHQHAVAGVVGEAEAAEADQAGAGRAHLVADHGGAGRPAATSRRRRRTGRGPRSGSAPPRPRRPCPRRDAARPSARRTAAGRAGRRAAVGVDHLDGAGHEPAGGRVGRHGGLVTSEEPTR